MAATKAKARPTPDANQKKTIVMSAAAKRNTNPPA